ncbi:uncharacterized protein LOC109887373 isoform X1 [Oncorhynchus kisutch]|uniref:Uncharacterized LOC109887373 n=2 Tax=Oncorhynchus kisutch TaxID=8019 RepID=A0A8C7HB22_ONCKI|nr:uncharacterized protein LOC109887373 isoform X1 [Oncorhynchus kisutch]
MDPSKEVAASVKDRMPAGEESEEPSSELPSTSSGMLTESVEEHDLETKISMLEKKLGFMKKSFMLDVPALLLTSLEELTEEQLKKFQSSGSICVFPLIPESQLENTDRQDTVVQMVKRYGPEGAVRNTLKILRRIKRHDVAQKLERDHTRAATWRRDSSDSDTWRRRKKHEAMRKKTHKKKKKEKRSFMLDVPALLLTGLEELTEEQLKIFQISLTTVQLPDFPPIPESQLENTDRQNTVDQMVKRYGPEGAVRNTWRILRRMNLDDLAEKLERYYSRGIPTKDYKSLVHPRPKSSLSHLYNAIHHSPSSSSSILPSGSSKELLSLTTGSSGQLSSQKTLDGPSLLLTSLEEMNPHELNRAWLPGSPLIPESQLENTDRQVTVDQMMKRYDPEEAMRIPFGNLKWRKRVDLAEKLERYHTRGIPTKDYKSLVQPRPFYSSLPTRFSSSSSFLPSGSSKELLSLTTGSSGQLSSQRHQILAVPALLLTTLEELTEEQLKTFQFYLTSGRMLDFPPIPERHLDNTDRQVTVDQIVKRYDHEGAVRNTLKILRRMNLDDLAEKLQRDHIRAVSTTETKWWSDSSDTGNDEEREKKHVHLSRRSRALDREAAGSKDTGITKDRYELVTKPTEKKIEALLLATLEELSTDELKILQQELTPSKQLPPYLTGFPPIPKTQLENNDRQVIVDQMLKRYGPEGVVEITLRILRRMNREDLAEKFERYHGRDSSPVFSQALYPPSVVMEKPSRFLPSSVQHSLQRPQIWTVPALLLTSLEGLTEEQLKTFQSNLTSVQPLGFPPISESQLENTDRPVTVDQMVKRYGPERAVEITLRILRGMKRVDLAEKLQRDHTRAVSTTETKWWSDSSDTGNDEEREKKHVHLSRCSRALDREAAGSKDTGITKDRYELVTKPTEKKIEALLLATLEELSTDELKILQQELTPSKQLPPYLTGFPPIPKTQLENNERQVIVDQMLKRYGPEGVVEITLRILRRMNREDLAEKFERYHGRGKKKRTSEEPSWPGLVSRGEKIEEHCVPFLGRAPFLIKLKKTPKLEMDFSTIPGSQLEMANSLNTEVSVNTQENTQRIDDEELRSENDSPPFLDHHHMSSPEEFTPEIHDQDNRGEYRFQCPSAGLFQCSITGLVFRMEGEGEVLYRTVHWDMRLLSQRGKRPAGPLFMFTCLKGSVCQLHLPHCEIYNSGGCDFLSVAHVTDDDIIEFLPPLETTETHVIINISGFSAYGEVKDEDSPTVPIRALVLLFYKPPVVPKKRSILNVLLLPRNVVIREVQEEWKRRNGDKYIYIETNPRCQLTPNKEYELFTDLTDEYLIQPKDAEFVDFESYENYFPTFQLFIQTVVEQVNLLLKDNGGEESVWDRLVWLPASPTDVPSTVSAVSPADPPANPSAPPGRAFIRRHRMALETRLGLLQPIFLRLQYHGVLIHEEREEVVSKSTKTLQNQTLLDMVVKKGARAQEHFYQVLKEVDPCLVEDLEEQTV